MILGFDTSGPYISIAVWDGQRAVATSHDEMAKGQAEALLPLIDALLERAGLAHYDLSKIGVGIGPGNFTGVRISVSAAKGLARGLGIPVRGVSGLEAAACGADGPVLACLAAPKDQAFVQGFGVSGFETPRLMAIANMPAGLGADCVGTAGAAIAEQIDGRAVPAAFAPGSAIARIAEHGSGAATPLYLREADAAPSRLKAPELLF